MPRISPLIVQDLLKSKVLIGYWLFLSAVGWGMFLVENSPEKVVLSLLQITLLVLPLITLVVATIYYYHSREFLLLLLAQPVRRGALIRGLYLGIAGAFSIAFLLGIGLPLLVFYPGTESGVLLLAGLLLSWIFVGLALLVGTYVQDKARGMGVALLLWASFAILFDGALLLLMYQLAAYPIERPVLALSFLNPVAIARVLVIMKTEASALLGLSGAVFRNFFGSAQGSIIAVLALLLWAALPYGLANRKFRRKDW